MFTGLIQRIGKITRIARRGEGARLAFAFEPWQGDDLAPGESVAVNGICLTVASRTQTTFETDVLAETLDCTTLGAFRSGGRVNLERALRLSDRMGGHFVSGHIDAIGTVTAIRRRGRDTVLRVRCGAGTMRGIVCKGSIALDGVSLTVSVADETEFEVNLIPTTLAETTLGDLRMDDNVNLETDLLGKYARNAVTQGKGVTFEALETAGFGE